MKIELVDIPGLSLGNNPRWRVKVLSFDGKKPALDALLKWKRAERNNYNKIIKVIKFASSVYRVTDKKKVKKTSNPNQGNIYEFRADKSNARLFFFYDEDDNLIICTNNYWKNKGNQNNAFANCAELKAIYYKERKKQ